LLLLFNLYHTCLVLGNPVAVSERGESPLDPQGRPRFAQIATTAAPMSPTLLYALDAAGSVWLFNFAKKKWGRLSNDREI